MSWKDRKILVVGDIMIDRYLNSKVDRISPEAPVPIATVKSDTCVPGGAANTANNISALGGKALLAGVVGNDAAKNRLIADVKRRGINSNSIVIDKTRRTMQKVRLVCNNHQIVRMDYEDTHYIDGSIAASMLKSIGRQDGISAIILSDYAKGTLSKELFEGLHEFARDRKIPLLVDPRPKHASHYKGCTVITPNKKEAEEITGIRISSSEDVIKAGKALMDMLDCNVVLTRGEEGMSVFEKGKEPVHLPTLAQEVYDVSGAGDTVIAAIGLGLASGLSLTESCDVANHAAGIVVAKFGTATASMDELKASLERRNGKVNI